MAVSNFETAKQLKPDLPEIDNFLSQAKEYLQESSDRQAKIEELLKNPPPTAAPAAAGAATPAAPAAATPAATHP